MEMQTIEDNGIKSTNRISLTSNHLKLIAILAMVADHITVTFLTSGMPMYILLRFIGRFTASIML